MARVAEPALPGSGAVVQLGYAVAVLLGCAAANSARDIGGGWVLSLLAGVGGAAAVLWPVRWSLRFLLRPRRFRV
ncbi:hypothetical protein [Streptomyces sp. HPF1205]|uniref:hypothetical protein n=1 Tax=Streptomyces sp. HPF1205 TaxID=2873262 RepID=UPI001CEE0736|nr:hypothetical protein [Streptomyces sp. HPF1205]